MVGVDFEGASVQRCVVVVAPRKGETSLFGENVTPGLETRQARGPVYPIRQHTI